MLDYTDSYRKALDLYLALYLRASSADEASLLEVVERLQRWLGYR